MSAANFQNSTNLLVAINNLLNQLTLNLIDVYKSNNRVNNMGDALEKYVKDIFCNCSITIKEDEAQGQYIQYLSYIGNQNNSPDFYDMGDHQFC